LANHEPWIEPRGAEIIAARVSKDGAAMPAEQRGVRDGDWVRLASRSGETTLRALVTERVAPGVVYPTFHHPATQANVVTGEFSDWATNCPEYKVTAAQISPSNGPSEWQESYRAMTQASRRIAVVAAE
jgi:formate dehydrogenase major subunit